MRPLFKAFLIVLLVFLGMLITKPVLATICSTADTAAGRTADEGEECEKDEDCCDGAICLRKEETDPKGVCRAGLFTRGQTRECIDQGNCSRCDLLIIVKNVFQFLVQIAGALAVLSIIISGIMFMMGGGILGTMTTQASAVGVTKAKNALTATIVGLLIILFAWTMINVLLRTLGYLPPAGASWWQIQCSELGTPP